MNYFDEQEVATCQRLFDMLLLPPIPADGGMYSDGECFDPWDLFPCLYGSYSSAFDDMALDVLVDIRDGTFNRGDLASEMFREMLCTSGLCDYGSSPRVCFASRGFKSLLPQLIERWREYRALKWQ